MLWELEQILAAGIKFGAIYALAALGLVVIHKATKTVNFAHGAFAMLGAFASFLIVVHWQWPYWLAYALIPPFIGLVSAVIELLVLRPLRRADMFTVVIATVSSALPWRKPSGSPTTRNCWPFRECLSACRLCSAGSSSPKKHYG